jgi:hypothetical protein
VRFAFTGDINLGTSTLPGGVPADTGRAFLAAAAPHLRGDLIVGNLEGVLADTGTSYKCGDPDSLAARERRRVQQARHSKRRPPGTAAAPRRMCYAFLTPTALAPRLREAGFTHLNLANNHANDYGLDGRRSTERTLSALGLTFYGPLGTVAIDTVSRGDSSTVVGLVGFTTYPFAPNLLDVEGSVRLIDSLRPKVDLLVVTFHGGTEGAAAVNTGPGPEFLGKEPRGDLRQWARAVIDAGADVVVGHGPHVLRGIEFYRGRPVFYSLGNFATFRGFSLAGPLGITGVLQLELAGDRSMVSARLVPMQQRPGVGPAPDPDRSALALLRRISAEDFGADGATVTDDGAILPP